MRRDGETGEDLAQRHLVRRGWKILARNWRGGGGELDLIALRAGVVAIIEVKSRTDLSELTDPIRHAQERRLVSAARSYIARSPQLSGVSVRFDVIAVDLSRRRLDHIVGAFEMDSSADTPSAPKSRNSVYATERNDRR